MNENDYKNLELIRLLLNDIPKKYQFLDEKELKNTIDKLLKQKRK